MLLPSLQVQVQVLVLELKLELELELVQVLAVVLGRMTKHCGTPHLMRRGRWQCDSAVLCCCSGGACVWGCTENKVC